MDFDYFCEREIIESRMLNIGYVGMIVGGIMMCFVKVPLEKVYDLITYSEIYLGLIHASVFIFRY